MDTLFKDEFKERMLEESINSYNNAEGALKDNDTVDCPLCKNRGSYLEVKWENGIPYEVARICKCEIERQNNKRLARSGLTPLMQKKFDNFRTNTEPQKNMKELAMENAESYNWFFVGGQSGAGKTHITSAIANYLLSKRHNVLYSVWTEDFKELNYLQNDRYEYRKKLKELQNIHVLLIDDLFKRKKGADVTDADVRIAFEVINYRCNNNKKTIISSESTLSELYKIDEAIAGRISEKAGKYIINIKPGVEKNMRIAR